MIETLLVCNFNFQIHEYQMFESSFFKNYITTKGWTEKVRNSLDIIFLKVITKTCVKARESVNV